MKYLHIGPNSKIYTDFIGFIEENFDKKEHKFLYPKKNGKSLIENISFIIKFIIYGLKAQKIFIHGLFNKKMIIFLYIFRFFLKKSYWGIWGGDLYSYNVREGKNYFHKIEDYVKGNMKGYITQVERDFQLAQQWFKAKGKFYYCFAYPSNLYKERNIKYTEKTELWIQIGNSADSSNNHFEILDKLSKFKDMDIKLFCILSYGGDEEYKNLVIKKGIELFKDKFHPVLNFMSFDDYMNFLSSLDIAIFAHNRQQGFGNIVSLLGMGKTVYLKEEVTTYHTLEKIGLKIKSFNKLEKIEKNLVQDSENNQRIVKEHFSKENLIKQWKEIFMK